MVRALPLLLLFLSPAWWLPLSLAAAGEEGGDGCSPEFCGRVNISSPFKVVKEVRAETTPCGAPGFQVLCNRTTNTPVLGYTRRWSLSFEILDVFYGNASLRVADLQARHGFNTSAGLEGCHVPAENISDTFGPPFWISPSNQNLIFYNCTKPPAAARWPELQLVETKCRGNTFARVGGPHSYGDVDQGDYYLEGCNAIFVPVLGADGQANASSYEQLIRDGFLLTWPPPPPPTSSKFTRQIIQS